MSYKLEEHLYGSPLLILNDNKSSRGYQTTL